MKLGGKLLHQYVVLSISGVVGGGLHRLQRDLKITVSSLPSSASQHIKCHCALFSLFLDLLWGLLNEGGPHILLQAEFGIE